MGNIEHRLLQAALREQFSIFTRKVFRFLNPTTELQWNWHLDAICHALDRVRSGEVRRLIITVPPRNMKSVIASVAYPAFLLGKDPSSKILCISYSADLATDFARKCRAVINSHFYREIFPNTRVGGERDSAADFMTTGRGIRRATSVGGTLTGLGGDIVIVDDLHKPDDALSDARRTSAIQWFENTVYTRLDDKRTGAIVIVMQRLHLHDIVGHVQLNGDWTTLNLPAIAECDEQIPIGPGLFHSRRAGSLLHPARETQAILDELRQSIGANAFSAQYLQSPVPLDGNVFKRQHCRFYDALPQKGLERTVQSWDTAQSGAPNSDYSVCTTWKVYGDQYYLVDLFRKRLTYPDLKQAVADEAVRHKPNYVLVEDIGSGQALCQDLLRERRPYCASPTPIKPVKDKVTRAAQQSATFEAGRVHLPKQASWLDTLMIELLQFPSARNDDQVDSVTQFLNWQVHEKKWAKHIKVNWGGY